MRGDNRENLVSKHLCSECSKHLCELIARRRPSFSEAMNVAQRAHLVGMLQHCLGVAESP